MQAELSHSSAGEEAPGLSRRATLATVQTAQSCPSSSPANTQTFGAGRSYTIQKRWKAEARPDFKMAHCQFAASAHRTSTQGRPRSHRASCIALTFSQVRLITERGESRDQTLFALLPTTTTHCDHTDARLTEPSRSLEATDWKCASARAGVRERTSTR